jgi:oxygen-independent coproporphyrinogen-3 oxidase
MNHENDSENPAPSNFMTQTTPLQSVLLFLRPGQIRLPALPPLTLYVHVPWCVRKCPYCDFNSHAVPGEQKSLHPELERRYLDALRADLESSLPMVWGRRVHAVFIGGGTPSLLSASGLERLLNDIRSLLPIEADAEITLEANPGTVESGKFAEFARSGINRISIGIQSFNDRHLQAIGRVHDGAEASRAVEIAQRHFANINLDLMYALPGQSLDECTTDIRRALAYGTQHLSVYHLSIEPNTVFAKFPPVVPCDDDAALMQESIDSMTAESGFEHYEISAYARTGKASRHNLNYWHFGDYLGIGAGAHGKLSFPERVVRQARFKQPEAYMESAMTGHALVEEKDVPAAELGFEFMLNALRLTDGVPVSLFAERTGLPVTAISKALAEAQAKGLMSANPSKLEPTQLGRRFLNDLQAIFL